MKNGIEKNQDQDTTISIVAPVNMEVIQISIGQKKLSNRKVLNLVMPFTKYDDEAKPYKFSSDLHSDVSILLNEVEEYLNGKHAPASQMSIAFEGETETGFDE